jgi:hypothetical protein
VRRRGRDWRRPRSTRRRRARGGRRWQLHVVRVDGERGADLVDGVEGGLEVRCVGGDVARLAEEDEFLGGVAGGLVRLLAEEFDEREAVFGGALGVLGLEEIADDPFGLLQGGGVGDGGEAGGVFGRRGEEWRGNGEEEQGEGAVDGGGLGVIHDGNAFRVFREGT